MLNPPVNGKNQGLFKAFECLSSTFQGKFNCQGLLKDFPTVFKSPACSNTFQACANPDILPDSNQNHPENTSTAYRVCYNLRQNNVGHP